MKIHILIPVYNRLKKTKEIIFCLRNQIKSNKLNIVVIDDGSNDGSKEWLKNQNDITVLKGNSYLYWGGAIKYGINYLIKNYDLNDWVIFINNDVWINNKFVSNLYDLAKSNKNSAIGSSVRHLSNKRVLVSIGPIINTWHLKVHDKIKRINSLDSIPKLTEVDALSGRGVIYSLKMLKALGNINTLIMPHYLSDYVLSMRLKKKGIKLLVSMENSVYSNEEFDQRAIIRKKDKFFKKYLSRKSSYYLPALFKFWLEASNFFEKLTLPLRLILFTIKPSLRK